MRSTQTEIEVKYPYVLRRVRNHGNVYEIRAGQPRGPFEPLCALVAVHGSIVVLTGVRCVVEHDARYYMEGPWCTELPTTEAC